MEEGQATKRLRTPVCDLLGIELPVFQAGMGFISRGDLAAAVSEAGGLGCIGAAHLSAAELREEIGRARALTRKPFAVDIIFGALKAGGEEAERYSAEVDAYVRIVLEERVPILVSGLGLPGDLIRETRRRGGRFLSVAGSVRHAEKAAEAGVDAVIASGNGGGGHTGDISTIVLVPAVVDAVGIPVIAGGGIADGRGLAAALALGAQGAWMGTRFIATHQSFCHRAYPEKLVRTGADGTVVTRALSGKTARVVRNRFTDYWAEHPSELQPFPLQFKRVGAQATRLGRLEGDVENGALPAGQSVHFVREIEDAGDVVRRIAAEACEVLERLAAHHARPG